MKDRLLEPVAIRLMWLRPGWITLASALAGVMAAWAAWQGRFGVGAVLWILCRILDGLDGLVARKAGATSDLGGLLDLVGDYIAYAAIPIAMALRPDAPAFLMPAALLLLGTFYVNSAAWMIPAALLERRNIARGPTSITIPEGLISGGETVVFYTLFFLLPEVQVELFLTMAVLTALTIVQRMIWSIRTFRSFTHHAVEADRGDGVSAPRAPGEAKDELRVSPAQDSAERIA